ncbi:hypothetical protein F5Y17DRAFT_422936 [Xylariaceae sp. FL0594]|nr:hypothetical protein F5Y17DRAFT_422936 [Xylariaceae sp. FL0594]
MMKGFFPRRAPMRPFSLHTQRRPLSSHLDVLAKNVDFLVPPTWDDPPAKISSGDIVNYVCQKYDIGFSRKLRPARLKLPKNPWKLNAAIAPQHCFSSYSHKYFDLVEHPWAKSQLDLYVEKTKTPLWLQVESFGSGATPVPCRKSKKKFRTAIIEALAAAGYDVNGRKQLVDGESSPITELYGTLRVGISDPVAVCNSSAADVRRAADIIVQHAILELRRDKNGQPIAQQVHGARRQNYLQPKGKSSRQSKGTSQHSRQTSGSYEVKTSRQSRNKPPSRQRRDSRAA